MLSAPGASLHDVRDWSCLQDWHFNAGGYAQGIHFADPGLGNHSQEVDHSDVALP